MTIRFDVSLTPEQLATLAGTDPRWWFTRFEFANGASPIHPHVATLEQANRWKLGMVEPWLRRLAPGARVLDVFCANGAFSYEAARAGARSVLGVDYDPPRIECARFTLGLLDGALPVRPRFEVANVYRLPEAVQGPFDLTLALGGLYHVADPALVLKNLRAVTTGHLILQTARIIRWPPGSWAKFVTVRRRVDRQDGIAGVWKLTPGAVDAMLRYAGFEVVERLPVPRRKGRRIPWYGAVCRAV
ncbi:MAG TPA: methyltransferase domain-containing protein [Actinomycetota bacterium]